MKGHAIGLDSASRAALLEALCEHAARSRAAHRPRTPGDEAVGAAERFAQSARLVGYASPADVDELFRVGTRAFLARDYEAARRIFAALLMPLADAEVDLGQDEFIDEVLGVDLRECAARYLASVYLTAESAERVDALLRSARALCRIAAMDAPIAAMERVMVESLPGLEAFLPEWSKRLREQTRSAGAWTAASWQREAVLRTDGIDGLGAQARNSRDPADVGAWCAALGREGDLPRVLQVNEEAARLVESLYERGKFGSSPKSVPA